MILLSGHLVVPLSRTTTLARGGPVGYRLLDVVGVGSSSDCGVLAFRLDDLVRVSADGLGVHLAEYIREDPCVIGGGVVDLEHLDFAILVLCEHEVFRVGLVLVHRLDRCELDDPHLVPFIVRWLFFVPRAVRTV